MSTPDATEFRPLKGVSASSLSRPVSILVNVDGPNALGVIAGEDRFLQIGKKHTDAGRTKIAVDKHSSVEVHFAACVVEIAAPKDGPRVIATVESDRLVLEVLIRGPHNSEAPVVVRTNTVADRGGAASLSTEGHSA